MVYKEHIKDKTQHISQNVLSFLIGEAQLGSFPILPEYLASKMHVRHYFFIWEFSNPRRLEALKMLLQALCSTKSNTNTIKTGREALTRGIASTL